jgi:ATP-binding cassette, subfamily B, multidrug efflux pump
MLLVITMKKLFNHIKWFVKKEWKMYVFMFILLVGIALFALLPGWLLGLSIDTIISGGLTASSLILLSGALVAFPLVRYVLSFAYNFITVKKSQQLAHQLRKKYLGHLFGMDSSFFEKYQKGDLISRVTGDLDAIIQSATGLLEGLVFNVGFILITLGIMLTTISWQLTLISVTIMPIGLTILNLIREGKRSYFKKHRDIYAAFTEKMLESVEGQKAIRAYVQEDIDLEKQHREIDRDIESWRYIVKFENWFNPLFEIIYWITYMLAFIFGTYFIIQQVMTLGGLITFVTYIGMLFFPFISISAIFAQLNQATIAVDRFEEILKHEPSVHDISSSQPIIDFQTIDFKGVTFQYPFDKQPVIKNVTFSIQKGQTIGIVGPTGAGKSTLIRQLLREFNVTKGSVLLDNTPIERFKIEDIRQLVGYVPQSHILFKLPVEENIKIGKPDASIDVVKLAIKTADFEKDLPYLQSGLQTMMGETGVNLSGGQKQRLSIARALIKDPQILILDDSLSAVDMTTERTIIHHLKEVRKGKTNIIVTHRFSAIKDADFILVLEHGEITQQGNHESLIREEGWYKRQYITQLSGLEESY